MSPASAFGRAAQQLRAAVALVLPYSLEAHIGPVLPAFHDYVAALDHVNVPDPRLGVSRRTAQLFTADTTVFAGFDLDSEIPIGDEAG